MACMRGEAREQVTMFAVKLAKNLSQVHDELGMSTTLFLNLAIRLYERFGCERTNDGPSIGLARRCSQ
jgi:hypothetical protein